MNLTQDPTKDQLRQLLSQCNDDAGHHIVWASDSGEVGVSLLPEGLSPIGFDGEHPDLKFRFGALRQGGGNVGPLAAADEGWVTEIFDGLVRNWADGSRGIVDP